MGSKKTKLHKAITNLELALKQYQEEKTELNFLTVTKAFEIATEYGWREFKRRVEAEGLEAQAPKMAIREAARMGLLRDPEIWLTSIDARNNSVHDYFGISQQEFVELAGDLLKSIKKIEFT